MADAGTPDRGILAERLDRLFETVQPLGRPFSLREVAEGVNEQAGKNLLSFQHVSQLRKGVRRRPGYDVLMGLAKWFGVPPGYFTDDEVARRTDEELEILRIMRDANTRKLAESSAGMSEQQFRAVQELIDTIQKANRLAQGSDPDVS
jgi:transcriptional regulator with XRE-family HTH domain